jgi:hypothetical protein
MMTAMVQCIYRHCQMQKGFRQEIKPCRRRSAPHLSETNFRILGLQRRGANDEKRGGRQKQDLLFSLGF